MDGLLVPIIPLIYSDPGGFRVEGLGFRRLGLRFRMVQDVIHPSYFQDPIPKPL